MMVTRNSVWQTATGQRKWIYEIDHQHFSNILWYIEILGDKGFYSQTYEFMSEEFRIRFDKRLPWKPLPIPGEIRDLVDRGLVTANGDIYGNDNTVIGTLTHILDWEEMI